MSKNEDADALRVLSDQLEETGLDAGAALLRDIAGRLTQSIEIVGWPEDDFQGGTIHVTEVKDGPDGVTIKGLRLGWWQVPSHGPKSAFANETFYAGFTMWQTRP